METVYILQIVTICITAITLIVNVLITLITGKQSNYNKIITESRLNFLAHNRENAAKFAAEAKSIALLLQSGKKPVDVKALYLAYEHICIALKTYNEIDKKIIDACNAVIASVEKSLLENKLDGALNGAIEEFVRLVNIYDDADWKFIKQQFNSTNKNSADFDRICDEVSSRYL